METKYQCKNIVASGHTADNLSRCSLMQWIFEELGLKIRKVEALSSGAAYCRLMDRLFPGCISLKKVKLEATVRHEYWSNFKQLQKAFRSVGCEKDIPIDRLVEGSSQENFEFLQWFKRFYDANLELSLSEKSEQTTPKPSSSQSSASRMPARPVAVVNPVLNQIQMEKELKYQIAEYHRKAATIRQEKDVFFNKLRNIELLCCADEARSTKKEDIVSQIFDVLYN